MFSSKDYMRKQNLTLKQIHGKNQTNLHKQGTKLHTVYLGTMSRKKIPCAYIVNKEVRTNPNFLESEVKCQRNYHP